MQTIHSKKFYTIEEQVTLLKNRGLSFKDENLAQDLLLKKNYFDIVNGFETLLLKDPKALPKEYESGSYFEHFVELYNFDKALNSTVLKAIDSFENRLKTSVAYRFSEYVFASNPDANPASYLNTLLYDNPYSIHNRINALPRGNITSYFVKEINDDINVFVNREVANIVREIGTLNTATIEYINEKTRKRLLQTISKCNLSILSANNAIGAANVAIAATPTVRGSGKRIQPLRIFTTTTINTTFSQISSSVTNVNEVQRKVENFINDIQKINIRVDKTFSEVAANSNTAINNVNHYEIKGYVGHNLFRIDHTSSKNKDYIELAKMQYSYLQKYEIPPFWVIIKTLELGSILKLLYGLKSDVLDKVVEDMGLDHAERYILYNSVKIIVDLRNHCAHFSLINRYRTKQTIKINVDLVNKLKLTTKASGTTHYEIRLYDTLRVLSQFVDLKEVSSLFKEIFMSSECLIDSKVLMKLLNRMGNDNFLKWCDF